MIHNNRFGYLGRTPLGLLYKCAYTGHVCLEKYMRFLASEVPQVKTTKPVYGEEGMRLRKESFRLFHANDANCNTCRHFVRVKADNAKGSNAESNFVYGNCSNPKKELDIIPYKASGYEVMVHVADWMGMPCWEDRTAVKGEKNE